jgi:hypothetical protein
MKRLLRILWIPLLIELANVLVHHVFRGDSDGIQWLDIIGIGITAAVMFFAGWTVARNLNRWGSAILAALLVWFCSVLAVVVLMVVESILQTSSPRPDNLLVVKGFLLSALLSIPVVIVVSAMGAALARWTGSSSR